jgi:hypothetical protein
LPNINRIIKSRMMSWAGHAACGRNAYKVLVGKPEEKRPLGGPRHRSENNIKMVLRETG